MSKQLKTIDTGILSPLVRQTTGRPTLELGEWSWKSIQGGAGQNLGIFRYLGQATDRGELVNWSLILKVLRESAEATTSTDWNYWRREVDVYKSDFLANLPEGIRAPHCFAVQELGKGRIGLWLEDIMEEKSNWTLADYGKAAYDFGRFNGTYLTGQPIPDYPWLSQQWLRSHVERVAPFIALLRQNLDHPSVKRAYPPDVAEKLFQLWAERDWYFHILAQLPQTLCHMDAFRRNLFISQTLAGNQETVVIDWAFVGPGAIGEELAPLISATIIFFEVDFSDLLGLEKQILEGYVAGLSAAGWQGDTRQVRLGYMAAASLRYSVGTMSNVLTMALNEQIHPIVEQLYKKPMGELFDHVAESRRQVTSRLSIETHKLARELGLA